MQHSASPSAHQSICAFDIDCDYRTGQHSTARIMSTSHALGAHLQYSEQEKKNIQLCQDYMTIAYDPNRASAEAVAHLCTADSTFVGQSTFPKAKTVPEYAQVHREVMESIHDLQLLQYDWVIAKDNYVTLRYTATGSHTGQPWHGVAGNGAKATWHAVMLFEVDEKQGKISKVRPTHSAEQPLLSASDVRLLMSYCCL